MFNYLAVFRDARNSAKKIAAGESRYYQRFTLFVIRDEDSVPIMRTDNTFKSDDAVVDYTCYDVQRWLKRNTGLAISVKAITDPHDCYVYFVDASLDCGEYAHHETLPEDKVYARLVYVPAL